MVVVGKLLGQMLVNVDPTWMIIFGYMEVSIVMEVPQNG